MRNAGQSDLTERETERVERTDKSGKTQKKKKSYGKGWHSNRVGGSTLPVIVNIKIQSHCLWREWHAMEQISYSVSV